MYYYVIYFILTWAHSGLAELNDGHYSEEDDAKVLPIVLPIVLVVVAVCVIACCWQGKKCPCNKADKNNKKKKQDNEEDTQKDHVFTESERRKPPQAKGRDMEHKKSQRTTSRPPSYSSAVNNNRHKDLPGHSTGRHESTGNHGDLSHGKRSGHHSRSSAANGYETGENASTRRVEDKYRVIDNRSRNDRGYSYGRENGGYHNSESTQSSHKYSQRQNNQYYPSSRHDSQY